VLVRPKVCRVAPELVNVAGLSPKPRFAPYSRALTVCHWLLCQANRAGPLMGTLPPPNASKVSLPRKSTGPLLPPRGLFLRQGKSFASIPALWRFRLFSADEKAPRPL
jgi:hypothetical protein